MKALIIISRVLWIITGASLMYPIGNGVKTILLLAYSQTGGIMTAKDTLELNLLPITFGIIGAAIAYKLTEKP